MVVVAGWPRRLAAEDVFLGHQRSHICVIFECVRVSEVERRNIMSYMWLKTTSIEYEYVTFM